jgi:hypothetical protein
MSQCTRMSVHYGSEIYGSAMEEVSSAWFIKDGSGAVGEEEVGEDMGEDLEDDME